MNMQAPVVRHERSCVKLAGNVVHAASPIARPRTCCECALWLRLQTGRRAMRAEL